MAQVFKNPIEQANSISSPSLRERWNRYLDNGFDGDDTDYWNDEIIDIESQLPFISRAEHDDWLHQGSIWKGEPGWPALTDKILKRIDKYGLDPNQIKELQSTFKGKDYDEAIKRLIGGEAFGDILTGVVPYEGGK